VAHQRKLIRDAAKAALVSTTAAGTRVVATRMDAPYRRHELPAISLYTIDETVDREASNSAPRELVRELRLEIAGWVTPGDGADDRMDALALEIEAAMDADRWLGGKCSDSILEGTACHQRGEADKAVGLVTLTYSITYRTPAYVQSVNTQNSPGIVGEFREADTTTQIGGADTAPVEDLIQVRAS
jgi:hypothetical protein